MFQPFERATRPKADPRGPLTGSTDGPRRDRCPFKALRPAMIFSHTVKCQLSGSLATRYSFFFCFRTIFGQTRPQNPSRTTGLVPQCRLHQQSLPETNSNTISLRGLLGIDATKPYEFIGFGAIDATPGGGGRGPLLAVFWHRSLA